MRRGGSGSGRSEASRIRGKREVRAGKSGRRQERWRGSPVSSAQARRLLSMRVWPRAGLVGEIVLYGEVAQLKSLRDALSVGIGYVPEDRGAKSLFLGATVGTNLTSAILDRVSSWGFLKKRIAIELAGDLAKRFQIRTSRLSHPVQVLSGGNQQKVAIAKSVALEPRLLILNEPTRGVDVGPEPKSTGSYER